MPEHFCNIYVALTGAALWIATNLALRAIGHVPFDGYPFVALQGVVALSALVIAISIVTTETRLVHPRSPGPARPPYGRHHGAEDREGYRTLEQHPSTIRAGMSANTLKRKR